MKLPLLLFSTLVILGCTPKFIDVKPTPDDALNRIESRLNERGVKMDPSSRSPNRVRTVTYCFRPADRHGFSWDRAFGQQVAGPIGFSHIGTAESQDERASKCERRFRVTIRARRNEGKTRLKVEDEWWRLKRGRCVAHGLPAMAKQLCRYDYVGTRSPGDIRGHIYGIVRGL